MPFKGNTAAVLFDAILNRAPIFPNQAESRAAFRAEKIINKALEKDRELRCQSATELLLDLTRLKRDTDSGRPTGMASAAGPKTSRKRWMWTAAFLGCSVITIGIPMHQTGSVRSLPHPPRLVPLTSFAGKKNSPAFSPDGSQVAFALLLAQEVS
jgi:hypothetical protein